MCASKNSSPKRTIRKIKDEDLEPTSRHMSEAFVHSEPMSICVKETVESFLPQARGIILSASPDNLSYVCEENSEIVGCCIAEGLKLEANEAVEGSVEAFLFALKLEWRKLHPELSDEDIRAKVVYIPAISVKPDHQRKGIATKLAQAVLDNAKRCGYQLAYLEGTARGSQYMFGIRLQFKPAVVKPYKDFLYNGQPVFAPINDPPEALAYEKNLVEYHVQAAKKDR